MASRDVDGTLVPQRWTVCLFVALGTLVAHPVLPAGPAAVLYGVVALGAGPLGWWATRRGGTSASWQCIAAALASFAIGDVIEDVGVWLSGSPLPFSPSDVFHLAATALLAVGLWRAIRTRFSPTDPATMYDALILVCGAAMLSWVVLVEPGMHMQLDGLDRLALAYPLCDLVLLALLARMLTASNRVLGSDRLLAAGLMAMLGADAFDAWGRLHPGGELQATLADLGWMAGYGLIAAAALHPSASRPAVSSRPRPGQLSDRRLVAFAVAGCLAPGVLLVQALRDEPAQPVVIGTFAALMFLLVLARTRTLAEDLRGTARELDQLAHTDPLTAVLNRRGWDVNAEAELARATRDGAPMCVVMVDLDHFKAFNDTHGHPTGDALLREAASAWRRQLRPRDLIARYGGEEFVVLLACDQIEALEIVARLHQHTPYGQTFSGGLAVHRRGERVDDLVARADMALYRAKRNGRARVELDVPDDLMAVGPPRSALRLWDPARFVAAHRHDARRGPFGPLP